MGSFKLFQLYLLYNKFEPNTMATIRTRKFLTNRILNRRQMVVDVIHPGKPNISKNELKEKLATMYRTTGDVVMPFGFKTDFGGGRSPGFALIYDNVDALKKVEPKYRIKRFEAKEDKKGGRRQRKELKNRKKKVSGKAKSEMGSCKRNG